MELIVNDVTNAADAIVAAQTAEQINLLVAELSTLELALVGGGVVNVAF